jgi:hypothetical protein
MTERWITCANCKKTTAYYSFMVLNKLTGESIQGNFCRFCQKDISLRCIPQIHMNLTVQVEFKRLCPKDIANIFSFPQDIFNIINNYYAVQFDFCVIKLDKLLKETVIPFYKIKQLRIMSQGPAFDNLPTNEKFEYISRSKIRATAWQTPCDFWENGLRSLILNEDKELFLGCKKMDPTYYAYWQELPLFFPKSLSDQFGKIKQLKRRFQKETCKLNWLQRNTMLLDSNKINQLRCKMEYTKSRIDYKRQKIDELTTQHLFIKWS